MHSQISRWWGKSYSPQTLPPHNTSLFPKTDKAGRTARLEEKKKREKGEKTL